MPIKLMNVSQYNSEFSMSLLVLHPTDQNLIYKIAQYCVTQ